MPALRIIPCLDCADGRVVKGVRFEGLRDAGDPAAMALAYQEQGADELVVLDVAATNAGRKHQHETVRYVREVLSIPLTVGGGVREAEDVAALLDDGADKVSINTAAVQNPQLLAKVAQRHGAQCTVLAIDAAGRPDGTWEVVIRSGKERTGMDAVAWAKQACDLGVGEILLTSFDRDGTRTGYDLPILSAICQAVQVPVIASGGAASAQHLIDALHAGADAVLAASIFHDKDHTVGALKQALAAAGLWVRP